MSHTSECATVTNPDPCRRCTCFEPDTDWAPDEPCGGISVNGATPPLCEVHMKPWGHRRANPTHTTEAHDAPEAS